MAAEYGTSPEDREFSAIISHTATVTGLIRGAVACGIPGGTNWRDVALPSGVNALNVVGVVYDEYGSSGPAVGLPVGIRVAGPGEVNLVAGGSVDYEDELIVANAQGDVKKRTNETNCHVVAISKAKVTAGGSRLAIQAWISVRKVY